MSAPVVYRKDTPQLTLHELNQYISLREKGFRSNIYWEDLKHSWVTEDGRTIWSLAEEFLNSQERPIGVFQPPLSWFKNLYSELLNAKSPNTNNNG